MAGIEFIADVFADLLEIPDVGITVKREENDGIADEEFFNVGTLGLLREISDAVDAGLHFVP